MHREQQVSVRKILMCAILLCNVSESPANIHHEVASYSDIVLYLLIRKKCPSKLSWRKQIVRYRVDLYSGPFFRDAEIKATKPCLNMDQRRADFFCCKCTCQGRIGVAVYQNVWRPDLPEKPKHVFSQCSNI